MRSPGFAWKRAEIGDGDAEAVLLLDRGGELALETVGDPWPHWAEVEVRAAESPGHKLVVAPLGYERELVLADLPPGRYVAEVRDHGRLIGRAEGEVFPGERTRVELALVSAPIQRVSVEGTLHVPAEWKVDDFALVFDLRARLGDSGTTISDGAFRIARSEMTAAGGGFFRWSCLAVRESRYQVSLFGVSDFETELDTGPAGCEDVRIEVPPPGRLRIHCLDERSGVEPETGRVWLTLLGSGIPARTSIVHGRLPLEGLYAQGTTLLVFGAAHEETEDLAALTIGPGLNEVWLQLGSGR